MPNPVRPRSPLALKKCLAVLVVLVLSSATPLLPSVLGYALQSLGDYFGDFGEDAPSVYVVLGGGLTKTPEGDIALNRYSELRAQAAWDAYRYAPLPVLTSSVESPWLSQNLIAKGLLPDFVLSENASMNTCENARFSAKLLRHETQKIPPTKRIYVVSDGYHMARTRRQFAKAGLATSPIVAPLPTPLSWSEPFGNLDHSRRAIYELSALIRDTWSPQKDCRHAQAVSIDVLKHPRNSRNPQKPQAQTQITASE